MLLNNDPIRLKHIIDSTREALDYIEGVDRTAFYENRLLQHGIVRCIEIVGEASTRLSKSFCEANPNIPWPAMIAMRNRIVHAYFDIDIDLVWETVTEDLPELLPAIVTLYESIKEEEPPK